MFRTDPTYASLTVKGKSYETLEISVPSFTISETPFFLHGFNMFPLEDALCSKSCGHCKRQWYTFCFRFQFFCNFLKNMQFCHCI